MNSVVAVDETREGAGVVLEAGFDRNDYEGGCYVVMSGQRGKMRTEVAEGGEVEHCTADGEELGKACCRFEAEAD